MDFVCQGSYSEQSQQMAAVKRRRNNFASVGITVCTFSDKSHTPYTDPHKKLISKFPFKNDNTDYLYCTGQYEDRPFEPRTDTHTALGSRSCIPATFHFSIYMQLHSPPLPPLLPTVSVLWSGGGFVWSNGPESYAGRSVATGMASRIRQVKGDDPDKKGYAAPPGWGFRVQLTAPHCAVYVLLRRF
jgi:hypothetical protein